jgi:signal transduction histidine kinase
VALSLRTRLLASFFIAIALPLTVLGLYAVTAFENATFDHLVTNLAAMARLVAAEATAEPPGPPLAARLTRWAHVLGVRIALVDGRGAIVTASDPLPPGITAEPGITAALRGTPGHGRASGHSGVSWLYVAVPVEQGGSITGATDLLLPLWSVEGVFARLRWTLTAAFGLVAVLAGGLVLYLTQALFAPIAAMRTAAERIGAGDLRWPAPERRDELGDLARVLNAMARQLDERETIRRDFLANVSHELRTPVANVQFTAQALMAGAADDPDRRRQMLETISREADRLGHLVAQLLDLLSLQSGRLRLARTAVAANDLMEDAVNRFSAHAEAADIRLQRSPETALPPINGDPDRLAEVLDNLFENALRSTPSGGTISISASAEDGFVVLKIKDTGRGIRESDLPFVFEKFYRGDTARDRTSGGSGLGLSIVKAIVEAHGGSIAVGSREGHGTTFVIRLPAVSVMAPYPEFATIGPDADDKRPEQASRR